MAYDFNGTTGVYEVSSAVVTALPITLACWFNADSAAVSGSMLAVSTSGGTGRVTITAAGTVAGDPVQAGTVTSGGTATSVNTTTGYTVGTWHHACAVFASSTSRTVYIDGGSSATDTTSVNATGMNRTNIGARYSGTLGSYFDGKIAEAAVWNVALTAAEVASLAKGFSPIQVNPQGLIFYVPLINNVVDLRGGVTLTPTGSPALYAQPRVYKL